MPRPDHTPPAPPDRFADLRSGLNERQEQAVFHKAGPLLILAGAGSGKTRVLTHRIAYLVRSGQVGPWEILAITFTNKAAAEMKERVAGLVGGAAHTMWVSTFHAACARMLRRDAELLGYRPGFSIYDQDDQVRLVRHCLEELNYDIKRFPPRGIHARISDAKNRLVDVDDFLPPTDGDDAGTLTYLEVAAETYRLYQKRLYSLNAMDFDDLLMRMVDVLRLFPRRLEHYRQAFRQILVDEYQDTNHAQYMLVKLLGEQHQQVTVVGDDDQSVYSWRGADIRNIMEFERDFPAATVVKLEQNYRSTTTILEAANAVVERNRDRKPKHLWTDRGQGEKIVVLECRDEHEEARLVAGEIERLLRAGRPANDIAVFYRVNAQSRVLEDILVRYGVAYQVVGGTRFYERAEIKDAIGYLRAIINPADDLSLTRILNTPRRGLGAVAQGRLQQFAQGEDISLRGALTRVDEIDTLAGAARNACAGLDRSFERWEGRTAVGDDGERVPVAEQVRLVLEESGLVESLKNEHSIEAEGRLENLQEFVGVAQEYDRNNPEGSLREFLEEISLYADIDALRDRESMVTLMTLHNAKGLEFGVVFIVGMEEGVFPHSRALDEQNLDEERRLCYVGLTRAKDRLLLSYAQSRSLYGAGSENLPSRFLEELPSALVDYRQGDVSARRSRAGWSYDGRRGGEEARRPAYGQAGRASAPGARASRPSPRREAEVAGLSVGDTVVHAKFGEGRVLTVESGGVVRVFFPELGEQKKLLLDYAPLKRV